MATTSTAQHVAAAAALAAEAAAQSIAFTSAVKACFVGDKTEITLTKLWKLLRTRNTPIKRKRVKSMVTSSGYLYLSPDKKQVLLIRNDYFSGMRPATNVQSKEPSSPVPTTVVPLATATAVPVHHVAPVSAIPVTTTVKSELSKTTRAVQELDVHCDTEAIIDLLGVMALNHLDLEDSGITDIFIDVGSNMAVKANGECFQQDHVVTRDDVDNIIQNLPGRGPVIEKTNRVIFGQTLHRLAAVAYDGNINGVTIRLGRSVSGLLPLFEGLIEQKNVLLCGAPNVGKTTTLREICKHLSRRKCLCLIDTSGEVCGDSENKDHIVGSSRVFRPFNPEHQYLTLLDCVRNHSPDIIAIDELHTKGEVEVCQTIALRSIQMVASVHGNIQDLVFNPMLNKSLGGVTQALVSDRVAVDGKKVVLQRTTRPIFDVVINIKRTPTGLDYQFIENVADNVTKIMQNKPIQTRTRRIVGGVMEETIEKVLFSFD